MADADPRPPRPPEPLAVKDVSWDEPERAEHLTLWFNRAPTAEEVSTYRDLPPTPVMLADTRAYVERMMLAELVARLFRFYILGSIVLPETPRVMDWLKSYIDGDARHGPLGHAMLWPDHLPAACRLLTQWGYLRTPGQPGFVMRRPGS